jgi:cytochrome oxidase Cu insertion factor (SCO1/SenC/PrrC family)
VFHPSSRVAGPRKSTVSHTRFLAPAVLLGALAAAPLPAADPPRRDEGKLKVGDAAPDFTVKDVEGKETTKLAELKGKPVVLIFGSCT